MANNHFFKNNFHIDKRKLVDLTRKIVHPKNANARHVLKIIFSCQITGKKTKKETVLDYKNTCL